MRTALIDGDTLVYETTTATEKATKWDNELWTLHGFEDEAQDHFDRLVQNIKEAVDAEEVIIALSALDPQRWREAIMPTYKQHRRDKRKPLLYVPIREHCARKYKTLERPKLEGDDVLGILATHPSLKILDGVTDRVVVSIDKDLKTIPGEHYNYQKEVFFRVDEDLADWNHMMQTLTGDTTDGYPGCPKIGPVSAEKLLCKALNGPEDDEDGGFDRRKAWQLIVAAYQKAGLSEEVALLNARVARICRADDYNFTKREVVLWNPPK